MIALGLVLLVLCLIVGAGVVLANTETVSAEAFGASFSGTVGGLFLLGAALGGLTLLALGLMLAGAARRRAQKKAVEREVHSARNEQETLAEENARLQAELQRKRDAGVYPSDHASDGSVHDESVPGESAQGEPARGRHGA